MRKNSIKNIRINNEVRKELSNIISNEVKDPRIRTRIAKTINLRNTPEIEFIADDSIEYGVRMSKLIDDVKGDSATEAETEED